MNIIKLAQDLTPLLNENYGATVFESNRAARQIIEDAGCLLFENQDEDEFLRELIFKSAVWDKDGVWISPPRLARFIKENVGES